jgi:hypothetical protein
MLFLACQAGGNPTLDGHVFAGKIRIWFFHVGRHTPGRVNINVFGICLQIIQVLDVFSKSRGLVSGFCLDKQTLAGIFLGQLFKRGILQFAWCAPGRRKHQHDSRMLQYETIPFLRCAIEGIVQHGHGRIAAAATTSSTTSNTRFDGRLGTWFDRRKSWLDHGFGNRFYTWLDRGFGNRFDRWCARLFAIWLHCLFLLFLGPVMAMERVSSYL